MIGKRCDGRRVLRATIALEGTPKPAWAAACDPARLPSATRAAKSYTPFTRPAANTPGGKSCGTNCCSSSENPRRAARLQRTAASPRPSRHSSVRRRSRCAAACARVDCGPTHRAARRPAPQPRRPRPRWLRRAPSAVESRCRAPRTPPPPRASSSRDRANRRCAAMRTPCECRSQADRIRLRIGRHHHDVPAGSDADSAGSSRHAPDASSTPGRSLLRNTAGCSMTPVANTTAFARILVMRCGSASATQ